MLIALVGPPCSGKAEVAKYLIVHHRFRPAIIPPISSLSTEKREALTSLSSSSSSSVPFYFDTREALLDHATAHWRDNIVTLDLSSAYDLSVGFDKRPWFLLVAVDAPLVVRWQRAAAAEKKRSISLEDFVQQDDEILFGAASRNGKVPPPAATPLSRSDSQIVSTDDADESVGQISVGSAAAAAVTAAALLPDQRQGMGASAAIQSHPTSSVQPDGKIVSVSAPTSSSLRSLMQQSAALTITNAYSSISTLHTHLATLSLASPHRLRPSWDTYFLSLCTLASLRSNCMKRRVGAVLVRSNRVLSTGYNGTPRGLTNCNEGGCPRCNAAAAGGTALDECLCLHAEENALLECGRERGGAEGTVLYCNTCPCLRCAVKIVQTGVKEVVYQLAYSMDDRSRTIFRDAGVTFRQYQPL